MRFRDFVYAVRTLRKSPVFAATAVITIALGIGASTAIFSVTNAVLLRPLPYKNPARLAFAISGMRKLGVKDFPFSNADFIDLRNGTGAIFEDLGAVNSGRAIVPREDGSPEQIRWAVVTPNFFHTMGGRIALGRDFTEADGQPALPPAVVPRKVILSYEYWQRRFGGDAGLLGRAMPGQGGTQVIGVLAPRFELLFPPGANMERNPDVWYAARLAYDNANRNSVSLRAIGRLEQGVTLDRAQAAVDQVAVELRKISVIHETSGYFIHLEPMQRHIVEEVRPL